MASWLFTDLITYVHEPVQHHILEHAGVDEITRPRKWLRRLSQKQLWSFGVHFTYMFSRVMEQRAYCCIMLFVSNVLCVYSGCMKGNNLVDVAFYKALAVLIGFLLSFRATRANERRTEAYILVENLCASAQELLYLFPTLSPHRHELKQILRFVYFQITRYFCYQYFSGGSTKQRCAVSFNLEKIAEHRRRKLILCCSLPELHVSPKQMIACLAPMVADMLKACIAEQKLMGGVGKATSESPRHHLPQLSDVETVAATQLVRSRVDYVMRTYESISLLENTKATSLYRTMLDITLFLFLAIFPWVMNLKSVIHMAISSLFVTFVYYGVDVVAGEVDDPFGNDITDIPLDDMVRETFELVDYEDRISQSLRDMLIPEKIGRDVFRDPTYGGSRDAWRKAMKEIVRIHQHEVAARLMKNDTGNEPSLLEGDEDGLCFPCSSGGGYIDLSKSPNHGDGAVRVQI